MKYLTIGRRDFLYLSLLGTCLGLSGCQINMNRPIISTYPGILPIELIKSIPAPWQFKVLKEQNKDITYETALLKDLDLLAIGDGWLHDIAIDDFSPISIDKNVVPFNKHAKSFLSSFDNEIARKLFPIGFSPWVMLFRRGESWIPKAKKTWEVLLEPELRNQLILPDSPRLVMALADRMGNGDIGVLRKLRLQAKTFDDRNALNWVISGKANVAVMPLQNCMSSLYKDPRLTVAIPLEGTPLNWTILLNTNKSKEPFPFSWIKESYKNPLLSKLTNKGWIPPLTFSELNERGDDTNLPFSEKEFQNFSSLTPLDNLTRAMLEERWLLSTP